MALLELRNVSKWYGTGTNRTEVLKNINLTIEEGEFIAIVGFTGSGKTTLISLIAGLIEPDEGEVLLNGEKITGPGPDRGVVFQNYSLLPWLSVMDNVRLAVDTVFPEMPEKEKDIYAKQYVSMVNLSPALNKKPSELSGGMRQRVSVARALAMNPKILLLDEPLSALDALTRGSLQDEISRIWEQDKKTVLLITNDVDEGIYLADRIIPLRPGPNATLGPEFPVKLERPRNKKALNHNQQFKDLRNAVNKYLMDVGAEAKKSSGAKEYVLPDAQPVDLLGPTGVSYSLRRLFN
ncbi:MAG: ABC transporter ATP-binding protein [Cytophaga sp.]|uniref:ABC transporter ATP-binding protein n=1 Tax=Cytophaga sp. TaxID=29535 RepID=UPI003F7DA637